MRILLVDDQGVIRAGLRALLNAESDMEVVGEAANSETALHLAEATYPDVILTEFILPGMYGLELIRSLKERLPHGQILVLTIFENGEALSKALGAGAKGYILKRAEGSELLQAIRIVAGGQFYIHHSLIHHLVERGVNLQTMRFEPPSAALSPRELDVLRLLAQGYTNRQMAEKLQIGIRTIETHRARLMEKLGLRNRAELVDYAARNGLDLPNGRATG